jgi:hypothetical protein
LLRIVVLCEEGTVPKKLTVLTVVLLAVLGAAIPAVAQEGQGGGTLEPAGPSPGFECEPIAGQATPSTASETADQQAAGGGAPGEPVVVNGDGGTIPCDQQANQAAEESAMGNFSIQSAPACALCSDSVLEEAEEAILGGESGGGTTPTDAFGAALEAARSSGDIREAAASEDTSGGDAEDTAAYLAAYDAAREAGADEETAREAALQAVADLSDEASDTDDDGSVDDAAVAATSKKAARGNASENDTDKDRKRDPGRRADGEESTGEGAEEEVGGGEDGGADGEEEEGVATSTGSGAPLLMGGGVLLVTGLFVIFRVAKSWSASTTRGRGM